MWRTRAVQRKSESQRWGADAVEMVGGMPRHTQEEHEAADGASIKVQLSEKMYSDRAPAIYRFMREPSQHDAFGA